MAEWFAPIKAEFELNFIKADRWEYLVTGLGNTLLLTLVALIVGVIIGVVVAAVRSTYDKTAETARPSFGRRVFGFFNGLCKVYLTVVRGTPVVVQVMIFFYVIFAAANTRSRVGAGLRHQLRRLCGRDHPRRHHVHRQRPVRGRPQSGLQLFADHALHHRAADDQKRAALADE